MAELTRRATTLIKEMLTADGQLPAFNEDVVRQTLQQVSSHQEAISQMLRDVTEARQQQQQQQQQEGQQAGDGSEQQQQEPGDAAVDWANSPEAAGAIVVHHETILKLKRILLTYVKMRADCLIAERWQQRMVRQDVRDNMSPQEQQFWTAYDGVLSAYMGPGEDGVGADLTLDLTPPKDANVRVMVLQDHGSICLSHSACVPLVKGSVHNLKCSEAEHLVRMGVLQVLDPNC